MLQLTSLHTDGIETQDPSELTGSLKGRENIYNHLEYQIKSAKNRVVIATTEEGLKRKTVALLKQIKKAKERGVEIMIAAPYTEKTKKEREMLSEYAEMKNITMPSTRACIVDNKQVTLMLTDDKEVHPSYDLAIWMNSPYFAKSLTSALN